MCLALVPTLTPLVPKTGLAESKTGLRAASPPPDGRFAGLVLYCAAWRSARSGKRYIWSLLNGVPRRGACIAAPSPVDATFFIPHHCCLVIIGFSPSKAVQRAMRMAELTDETPEYPYRCAGRGI